MRSLAARPRRLILLLLLGVLLAAPAAAQVTSQAAMPSGEGTLVTFALLSEVSAEDGRPAPALPVALMERLAEQPALADLRADSRAENTVRLEVRFVFEGMSAFRQWYESERVRELMEDLQGDGDLRTSIRVKRYPNARYSDEVTGENDG